MDNRQSYRRSSKVPAGIYFVSKICGKDPGFHEHRMLILLVTFIAYACFHASRKPLSIVKSVLRPTVPSLSGNLSRLHRVSFPLHFLTNSEARLYPPRLQGFDYFHANSWTKSVTTALAPAPTSRSDTGWDPFNGDHGEARLGEVDMAFLGAYAVGMYFAGRLGDRLDLRKFLTFGMVGSGTFVCLFGMGYWWNVHSISYYFLIQVVTGLLSATGWPAVVAIVANWFGKSKRGLVMGIWNAHTSVGNIAGSIVAAAVLHHGWGWSFLVPGFAIMLCSLFVFLFLVVEPSHVGLPSPYEVEGGTNGGQWTVTSGADERQVLLADTQRTDGSFLSVNENGLHGEETSKMPLSRGVSWEASELHEEMVDDPGTLNRNIIKAPSADTHDNEAIGFFEAWNIPGVAVFSICLFFVKLVAYTFLFWLPFYISHTEIAGEHLSDKMAGYLSTVFDIGGVIGGIIAGHLSDKYNAKAMIAAVSVNCAIPSIFLFHVYGGVSLAHTVGLMILSGIFVNGPYALITTAVSADLGTHSSLKGNARALATVTAIIDGTGSVGAAVGPFLTGYIAVRSWTAVFAMLAGASFVAGLLLTKLVVGEIMEKVHLHRATAMDELGLEELREF